jgi:ABC-2 type transport system permease protein
MNDTGLPLTAPSTADAETSLWRAWFYLVWLSWQRQLRDRQLVWISLGLLAFALVYVAIGTALHRWDLPNRRQPFNDPYTNSQKAEAGQAIRLPLQVPWVNPFLSAWQLVLQQFSLGVKIFFSAVVEMFLTFLLPLWSMSFATEALGGERESNSLIWLLTRPLPRPGIYLAKFIAVLPWSLALNLGGFALLCLVGGAAGRETLKLLWPAVLCGTLAFTSLFFFVGAFFRWPTIVCIVYTFFLEIILNLMPAFLKRVSLSFYTRCMMYDALQVHDVRPSQPPNVYMPVDGETACAVLIGATLFFLVLGMLWFARKEYHEIS